MDNKPRPKPNQGSTWENENDKMTNPNRRQDEETSVESQRSGQRASNSDVGSSESTTSDRDEQLHSGRQGDLRDQQSDTSRRTRQPEE